MEEQFKNSGFLCYVPNHRLKVVLATKFNELCQLSTLQSYIEEYEDLLNVMLHRDVEIPNFHLIDCFVKGLKSDLRDFVRSWKFTSVSDAMEYAIWKNRIMSLSTTKINESHTDFEYERCEQNTIGCEYVKVQDSYEVVKGVEGQISIVKEIVGCVEVVENKEVIEVLESDKNMEDVKSVSELKTVIQEEIVSTISKSKVLNELIEGFIVDNGIIETSLSNGEVDSLAKFYFGAGSSIENPLISTTNVQGTTRFLMLMELKDEWSAYLDYRELHSWGALVDFMQVPRLITHLFCGCLCLSAYVVFVFDPGIVANEAFGSQQEKYFC